MSLVTLNADQDRALGEIMARQERGERQLLTGYAGSGKTTLMQHVARQVLASRGSVVLSAPTHKAVSVLKRKLAEAGLADVPCRTIHSLLSLRPKPQGDRQVFERDRRAGPVMADLVVIDECSMLGEDLMRHIKRHLPMSAVLFVGDPAQLPPVGEAESQAFATKQRSHLDTIVRQGAGNPVLDAAHAIRQQQGSALDWTWCRSAKAPPLGVYLPADADTWMRKAFTSPDFDANPDRFRYLAWTNDRVAQVNSKVRSWRYGENIPTPFMPGERALMRQPVVQNEILRLNTNEEVTVLSMARDRFTWTVPESGDAAEWQASLSSWRVEIKRDDGEELAVHMPADDRQFNRVVARITDEAAESRQRWAHLFQFKQSVARMQSIYALTIHTSQGSTFENAFVDLTDIRRRAQSNVLETQQLLYVAATRPSRALVLIGAAA